MADTKITGLLTPQVTTNPATDVLPIVNIADTLMAASGSTRKITVNQLLGAGGTATLASATITGDLTVRTNKLAVTSTNVGIGTASPTLAAGVGLEIENAGITTLRLQNTSGANAFELQVDSDANGVLYRGYNNSPHVFYVNNSTAMTLNSTGLGVGVSPNRNLDIRQDQSAATIARIQNQSVNAAAYSQVNLSASGNNWGILVGSSAANSNRLEFVLDPSGTNLSVMRLDTSGNVGIGVTPSAWNTAYAVAQVGIGGSIWSLKSTYYDQFGLGCNHFENTSGSDRYVNNGRASQYFQYQGTHIFRIAGNNTLGAGAALTWTPAMTLDASGNLILLSSNTPATLTTNGQLTVNATSNTNLRFSYRGSDGVTRVANITLA